MAKVRARFKTTSTATTGRRLLEVKAGEFVFRAGDLGTEMYVIHEGSIEIANARVSAEPLAILEKGDFFGEMAILEGAARTADAKALEDSTLVRISEATFAALLRRDPEVAVRIMRKLSRRLRTVERLLERRDKTELVPVAGPPAVEPAPVAGDGTQTGARLLHLGTGRTAPLKSDGNSTVGRSDPITGIRPTVDLTELDPERSSSRQHARIYVDGGEYFLVEEVGTANGTFLNESRLATGVPARIVPGDRVRFGLVTLEFAS